jgi:hypothetical protein
MTAVVFPEQKCPIIAIFFSQALRSTRTSTRLSEPKQAFPRNLRLGCPVIAGGVNAQCFI